MLSIEALNSEEKGGNLVGWTETRTTTPQCQASKEVLSYVYGISSPAMCQINFDSGIYGHLLVGLS